MTSEDVTDQQLAAEFFERISASEPDGAFEFMQFFMERVLKKDSDSILYMFEALARASAALGSGHAKAFLDEDWAGLKAVLLKRLIRDSKNAQ
jgi:hypothetical protein